MKPNIPAYSIGNDIRRPETVSSTPGPNQYVIESRLDSGYTIPKATKIIKYNDSNPLGPGYYTNLGMQNLKVLI